MTHLPFIAAAYGVTLATFGLLSISAATRLRSARRRLGAVETRPDRGNPERRYP